MYQLNILSIHIENSPEALPLGAASVAASILDADGKAAPHIAGRIRVELKEGLIDEADDVLLERALAGGPDWLGFSSYSWSVKKISAVAAEAKKRAPSLVLFAGGPEATADPLGFFAAAPLDFIALGEGETSVLRAVDMLAGGAAPAELASIPGIMLRPAAEGAERPAAAAAGAAAGKEGGEAAAAQAVPPRAPALDLSALPSPWLKGLIDPRRGVLWELARGCPFHCAYCYEGKGEKSVRRFSSERIEKELELFVKKGAEQVFVLDPTFDADRERARSILSLIEERAPGLHWKFEIRAEFVDRDLARRFARLDSSLQIGLQSANPEVCARVGRKLDPHDFERRVGFLNEAGAVFGFDLIYGLPGDDLHGFEKSIDYALELMPNHLDLFPLSVLPGTELADRAAEYGLVYTREPPYLLERSPGFPAESMKRAAGLARACDIFYSRGRSVAWFLQACRPLKMKPHALLERFASWLETKHIDSSCASRAIENLQLEFLDSEYRAAGLNIILPALHDIVRFNGAWGRALAEGESAVLELVYDPDEVLGPEALDLAAFARGARRRPGRYRLEPGPEGPTLKAERRIKSGGPRGSFHQGGRRGGF